MARWKQTQNLSSRFGLPRSVELMYGISCTWPWPWKASLVCCCAFAVRLQQWHLGRIFPNMGALSGCTFSALMEKRPCFFHWCPWKGTFTMATWVALPYASCGESAVKLSVLACPRSSRFSASCWETRRLFGRRDTCTEDQPAPLLQMSLLHQPFSLSSNLPDIFKVMAVKKKAWINSKTTDKI